MLQVTIPNDLAREIEQALPPSASAEEFVIDAVRQKLSWQESGPDTPEDGQQGDHGSRNPRRF